MQQLRPKAPQPQGASTSSSPDPATQNPSAFCRAAAWALLQTVPCAQPRPLCLTRGSLKYMSLRSSMVNHRFLNPSVCCSQKVLNYIPKYEVLCSSNATWQYQGKGGFGWLGGPCRARGGWERQREPGGPVVMAREQGNGLGSSVRCFWIFYLLVPNPNCRRKMCINVLMG